MQTKSTFGGNTNIPSIESLAGLNQISDYTLLGLSSGSIFTTSSTGALGLYSTPILVKTIVLNDRIELIYKRTYMVSTGYNSCPEEVYKIIYSCVDGNWNVSEPIFGEIIPASSESYEFED